MSEDFQARRFREIERALWGQRWTHEQADELIRLVNWGRIGPACERAEIDDTARLDYLDECKRRLNMHFGTDYGWTLILNHNVNRLMLGHLQVDLNDAHGARDRRPSCRAAIDDSMKRIAAFYRRAGTTENKQ